ncbi:LptF/LptG family permease [Bacteroides sp.]|uniref:LptF/LptG family permease n=1 Tax=Bacteroides sp. TaxID=29523 RepID=UPI0023CD4278|nr:LptF/LptG family permease [Bacteroides sp.]MDE5709690.1 LptF/LptG family permease [Bacteroides sp.]MDE6215958.1 LptF/LptG family permease [Bacteroides sp.]
MLRIKKLDIFVLKSFCLLFMGTFFICLFIFMMQFLWKYVDEMVGKGLEMTVLLQFFFYSALTLVPISLPLAVLLAALITFGNFGERFELLAMKAAGISLMKIMRPLIVFIAFISCVSFYFQNVIGPKAQTKLWTLLFSMKQKSPEVDIPEGVFYDEIDGYNLYVKHKNRKTGVLYDVLIYNFEKGFENAQIIKADSGKLEMTADKQHLYLHLYSGEQFENLKSQSMNQRNVPYRRETFREKHAIIEFDSDFSMADEGIMSSRSNGKNMAMLQAGIDSMQVYNDSVGHAYYMEAMRGPYKIASGLTKTDTLKIAEAHIGGYDVDSLFDASTLLQKQKIISVAVSRAESAGSDWSFKSFNILQTERNLRLHKTSWHEKLTLSMACLIFFFIGAPLGGIIRKGGLGMPVVVSVLIFIIYYIINNTGYKMARDGKWIVWMGMWTSTAILAPLGAFLTYKSNNDSVVLNADAYISWFKKVAGIRSVRHLFRKEVIIHDPDYVRIPGELRALSADCREYAERKALRHAPNYFKLWLADAQDEAVEHINERMESLIEEMANTRSHVLLTALNAYPVIPVHAHLRPFRRYELNVLCGIVFPVGLFFYFRIWAFRIRLNKDMERIVKTNEEVIGIIEREKNK